LLPRASPDDAVSFASFASALLITNAVTVKECFGSIFDICPESSRGKEGIDSDIDLNEGLMAQ
jgi:hypothetical protein